MVDITHVDDPLELLDNDSSRIVQDLESWGLEMPISDPTGPGKELERYNLRGFRKCEIGAATERSSDKLVAYLCDPVWDPRVWLVGDAGILE